jgi:hypothetical protein
MPTYTLRNALTKAEHTVIMNYKELQEHLAENPKLEHILVAINYHGDSTGRGFSGMKHTSDFREILQKVKKNHPLSTVDPGNRTEI